MTTPLQIIVTGTDTEVGKSYASKLICDSFLSSHLPPLYIKPFQSGEDKDSDFMLQHLPKENVYALESWDIPAAPHCSNLYEKEKKKAYYQKALTQTKKIINENKNNPIIVEGAGGVLVPIDKDKMIVDFFAEVSLPIVLVVRTGLGTVNHTLLTVDFLQKKGFKILAILLNDYFCSSDERINQYNQKIIAEKTKIKTIRFLNKLSSEFINYNSVKK